MQIYIYEKDGQYNADYNKEFCERMGKIVGSKSAETAAEMERIIARPGKYCPDRVAGLAERSWRELVIASKPGVSYRDAWKLPLKDRLRTAFQIARGKR